MRVLFVDDEEPLLRAAQRSLKRETWSVDFVLGGQAALDALRDSRYDLVLTDLEMPHVDGREILRFVRETCPTTRCVFVTGSCEDSDLDAQVLGKPYAPAELRKLVADHEATLAA